MKIFLTGGTGFIGSHFVNQAHRAGHEIIALRRSASSLPRIQLQRQPVWINKAMTELARRISQPARCLCILRRIPRTCRTILFPTAFTGMFRRRWQCSAQRSQPVSLPMWPPVRALNTGAALNATNSSRQTRLLNPRGPIPLRRPQRPSLFTRGPARRTPAFLFSGFSMSSGRRGGITLLAKSAPGGARRRGFSYDERRANSRFHSG